MTTPGPSSGAAPRPAQLNDSQARRIASAFTYIDGLLRSVERLAHAPAGARSAFAREQPDLSETEAKLLLALVDTARERMLRTLDYLGFPRPTANLSARWSIMTTLRFIDIALSELNPNILGGYGKIDADSAAEVVAVAAELRELIERGRGLLQPKEGERLRERLASLPGPLGEILRAAEELSTRHGLVEVRALIAAAADRATTSTIDVGIFGRVSSGKSSLINALVDAPLLPVGARPVTAVPLRIVHGEDSIEVHFDDGHRETIDVAHLPDFATEQGNRDNARGVQSIVIRTPRVANGLALLDTPGVGSLSQSGPAQAFAWLPRCDVGVVLVAAGTPLGRDELALIGGLTHAGIAVEVLLSKSDLVAPAERDSALSYVRDEIARIADVRQIRVQAISVMPTDRELLDRWRDDALVPLIARRERLAETARARRLRALVAAIGAAMTSRPTFDRSRLDLHRTRAVAEREIGKAADDLESSAHRALESAAAAVASAWEASAGERGNAGDAARGALLEAPNRALARARAAADRLLEGAATASEGDAATRLPPLFDPAFLDQLPVASAPGALDRLFGVRRARTRLAPIARAVDDAYGTYANRIRAWARERLEENFERMTAAPAAEDGTPLSPELAEIGKIVEKYFPVASG